MVEDTSNTSNKSKVRTNRPISIYAWSAADVRKWFARHCADYQKYLGMFAQHEITGRSLLRITENTLLRIGIIDSDDRNAIWREILKLKLKTDIVEIKDMESRNLNYDYSVEFV
ncbi:protein aveugle [Onthophagus taurus]|uniref:protein aveugle n=1 Tax=Onthophagus taurus TaxID=166361 RepID=UPI000C207AC0|nr:protein aveugle [Onthophagus taurus]